MDAHAHATFRHMRDSTADDWGRIAQAFGAYTHGLPGRVLDHLRLLAHDTPAARDGCAQAEPVHGAPSGRCACCLTIVPGASSRAGDNGGSNHRLSMR